MAEPAYGAVSMPEGHTLHRLARHLRRDLKGDPVEVSSPQGRFAEGAARLDGCRVVGTDAYGKHLFVHWDSGDVLYVHLGLIGKFRRMPAPPTAARGAIRLRVAGPRAVWDLSGPMACRVGDPDLPAALLSRAGPDPLRRDADPDRFTGALRRRTTPIGAALLDQTVISGVGNVYRAELCFLCGVHPARPSRSLGDDEVEALWDAAVSQLRVGARLGRIVTRVPEEVGLTTPARIATDERLYVYRRGGEPCHRCATPIAAGELGGRRTWWCPTCQPTPT
jgi:endonuclease VIII